MKHNLRHTMFRRPIVRKKLYIRLVIGFIALVFMTVLTISSIFFQIYKQSISKEVSTEYQNNLGLVRDEFDNAFNQAKQLNVYLRQNTHINDFLSLSTDDFVVAGRADTYLGTVKGVIPYLYSVILYNRNCDFSIISGDQGVKSDQFVGIKPRELEPDSALNIILSSVKENSNAATPITNTASVIFTESDDLGSIDSAIIMNMDYQEIDSKLLGKIDGMTFVVDKNGRSIFNPYRDLLKEPVSQEPYFQKILGMSENGGSFEMRIDGAAKIVCYTKSYMTGFYLLNIKDITNYETVLKNKESSVIMISLIILIVFAAVAYLLSHVLYSPIKGVSDMISRTRYGKIDANDSEITMITKAFHETQRYIQKLEIDSENSKYIIKEDFLRRLLRSDLSPADNHPGSYFEKLNIQFVNLFVLCLKIDNCNNIQGNNILIYEASLCSLLSETLGGNFDFEIVNMFKGEIALLLNFKVTHENSFNSLLEDMAAIRSNAKERLHITLTIGVGGVAGELEECAEIYKKAVNMVKHRFVLGYDNTIYQRLLDERLENNLYYPAELENKLTDAIRSNQDKEVEKWLQEIVELLGRYSYPEAVSALFQVISACIKCMNTFISENNGKFRLDFNELSTIFNDMETLVQAKEWILKVYGEYCLILKNLCDLKSNKHFRIIEKIQNYIHQNYSDINLSVDLLADIAGYTPSYLSKIYKDITGINLVDYIRKIRINKAKELLGQKDCTVNDIVAMVGINNISNFYSVFKKDVGLTPAAYREYLLGKVSEGSCENRTNEYDVERRG